MNRIKVLRILLVACLGLALVLVIVSLVDRPAAESVTATRTAFAAQAQPASGLPLCFVGDDGTACVQRAGVQSTSSISAQVRALVESMLAGPTAAEQANGVGSALPDGAQLSNLSVADDHVSIDLVLPDAYLKSLTPAQVENVNEQFLTTLTPYNFQRIDVNVRDAQGNFRLLSTFLAPIVIPHKQGQAAPSAQAQASTAGGQPPAAGQPQPRGGLYGKTVFVSAGHGWYWSTSQNQYRTQRPVYPTTPYPSGDGIVEDFNNAEAVDQYLLPYLWNSGADAWTVREQDMNSSMLIVDDKDGFSTQGGWLTGSGGYGGSYRFVWTVAAGATATATWTFTPPTTNTYAVYVWSPEIAATRAVDAHFYVEHAGGVTPVTVSQARDNGNWRYIGSYPFYGGQPGRVWVTNQSNTPGVFVLADAIRIGGGIADTPPPTTLSPSGRPRWEDQAWTYARWVGMPNADNPDPKEMNDVIVRPIYSEWEKDPGEDAVYIAWHTNGYNGYNTVARGTESYIHSFQPTPNSDVLQNYIHTDLLNAIHTGWDAAWPDRGKKTADLGELRLLSTMPGVLIENGYHDNPQDVEAMKDPRFDLLSARAIYHGLVRYWHSRDPNVPLVFLPEPPVHLIARNTGAGEVTLTWQPGPTDGAGLLGDAATSYRVYTSADGFGWSDAIAVPQTTYVLAGLQPGQLVYVRVTGVNAGGESFPTPVMAARADPSGSAAILIVYGFDRIDRYGAIKQYDPPEGYDRRVFADRINAFDYIIQHADAITLPFDSAQRDAVSDGSIGLNGYAVVDWIAGEDQSPQAALSAGDQSALGSFVSGGGALLIGGAKIGSDLQGTSFYANVLHAAFAGSANTHLANAQPGGVWSGLGNLQFDDGTHGTYDVDSPDAFNPIGGATTALVYNGGGPAAIQYSNGSCSRVVYSGVPLETIYPDAVRRSVFARAIDFLSVPDLSIASPADDVYVNAIPAFTGKAAGRSIAVQVSIHRLSDSTYFNGSSFVSGSEIGLTPNGASAWSYSLPPSLNDGAYVLRAWLASPCGPAYALSQSVTFTLDTAPPDVPTLITPTGGISIVAAVAAFAWTGGGDPDGFWLELDGVTTTLNSPELNARLPVTDGLHLWRVQAFDRAGNSSGWSLAGEFRTSSLKSYLPVVLRH